jgi:hypothetical protein
MLGQLRVGLFLMAVAGSPAAAESASAYLFKRCISVPAAAADPACTGYVYGVLNQFAFGPSDAALRRTTCFPKVVSPSQANAIVENYVRSHPERLRAVGAATVRAEAFNSVFPCRSN